MRVRPVLRLGALLAMVLVPLTAFAAPGPTPVASGTIVTVDVGRLTNTPLDVCDDGRPHVGPTGSTFTITPPTTATLIDSKPTVEEIRARTAKAKIRVNATTRPGTIFIVSWTAVKGGCYSANGGVTYIVRAAGGSQPGSGSGSAATSNHDCGTVLVGTRVVRVYIQDPKGITQFSQPCAEAKAVAQGQKIAGVICTSPTQVSRLDRYVLCTKSTRIIVSIPTRTSAGPTACNAVVHQNRRYAVFKQRVLCSYARATALRMLRRDQPYVYEFESALQAKRWRCRIDGSGTTERGACYKTVEDRWVLYLPAPR